MMLSGLLYLLHGFCLVSSTLVLVQFILYNYLIVLAQDWLKQFFTECHYTFNV